MQGYASEPVIGTNPQPTTRGSFIRSTVTVNCISKSHASKYISKVHYKIVGSTLSGNQSESWETTRMGYLGRVDSIVTVRYAVRMADRPRVSVLHLKVLLNALLGMFAKADGMLTVHEAEGRSYRIKFPRENFRTRAWSRGTFS